jgi:hypothetical protein
MRSRRSPSSVAIVRALTSLLPITTRTVRTFGHGPRWSWLLSYLHAIALAGEPTPPGRLRGTEMKNDV